MDNSNNYSISKSEIQNRTEDKIPVNSVPASINNHNIFSSIKAKFSGLNFEDIILFGVLFLLIEEGIEDEFLILIILFLILTSNND